MQHLFNLLYLLRGGLSMAASISSTLRATHHDLADLAPLDLDLVRLLSEAEVAPLGRHRWQAMRAVRLAGVVAGWLQA
jgi:hypothetical protein